MNCAGGIRRRSANGNRSAKRESKQTDLLRVYGFVCADLFGDPKNILYFRLPVRRLAAAVTVVPQVPQHGIESSIKEGLRYWKHLHSIRAAAMKKNNGWTNSVRMKDQPA
jgi:hypothetical protein